MMWRDDLADDWDDVRDHPPVDGHVVNPRHLGVGVDDLVVDLDDRR